MNLKEFIKTQIKSVPELRVLLFIQAWPQGDWDVREIARKLYLERPMVAVALTGLVCKGLLVSAGDPPRYRYQPQSVELAGLIEQLVEMDRVNPVTLVNLIAPLHKTFPHEPSLSSSQIEKRSR